MPVSPEIRAAKVFFRNAVFDRRLARTLRSVLSRFGAYVRSDARRFIGRRVTRAPPRPPGNNDGSSAPRSRNQEQLKKFIFFQVNREGDEVIIGPERLYSHRQRGNLPVPGIHEHGGRQMVNARSSVRVQRGQNKPRVTIVAHYPRRSYMTPSFQRNLARLRPLIQRYSRR